jgi:lipid-A-disaccharide synthase
MSLLPESPIPNPQSRRFALVAGETSGDLLGAGLIAALRERYPNAQFAGVGGPRMIAAGLEAWHPSEKLAVMGLVEVLKHLPELLAIRRDVVRRALEFKPDVFIGIDAPDFNLGVERRLKRSGIRTVHYVSPSIWAWREKRAAKIGRSADRVLCLFPMEPAIYARHGVDARFVGHPLADAFPLEPDRAAARAALGLPADATVLALLPGSRLSEIARLGADFIGAAQRLAQQIPGLRVVAPMAGAACRAAFASVLANAGTGWTGIGHGESGMGTAGGATSPSSVPDSPFPILITDGHAHEAMLAADAILLASGTATLEAMLAKRPMVVAYRIAPMTYRIVKGLGMLKVERYALPNILAGRALVPELMQDDCTPAALAEATLPMLRAGEIDPALLAEYRRLHLALRRDASRSAAAAIAGLIEGDDAVPAGNVRA